MKTQWLNFVLRLTNRIYAKKQDILARTGVRIVVSIFVLIILEIILAIVSLPLYLSVKASSVTAYLSDKGGYGKVDFDYNLRRVLTLTGVSLLFLVWMIKLATIIFIPNVYGPLQLYSVSDLRPVDVASEELLVNVSQIETSRVMEAMAKPELKKVKKTTSKEYVFSGIGKPSSIVVLLLSDKQTIFYSEQIDKNGQWEIKHSQDDYRLGEGNHSISVFSYDEKLGSRSNLAPEKFFKVTSSWGERLLSNIDNLINWAIVTFISIGIFLTILTI